METDPKTTQTAGKEFQHLLKKLYLSMMLYNKLHIFKVYDLINFDI